MIYYAAVSRSKLFLCKQLYHITVVCFCFFFLLHLTMKPGEHQGWYHRTQRDYDNMMDYSLNTDADFWYFNQFPGRDCVDSEHIETLQAIDECVINNENGFSPAIYHITDTISECAAIKNMTCSDITSLQSQSQTLSLLASHCVFIPVYFPLKKTFLFVMYASVHSPHQYQIMEYDVENNISHNVIPINVFYCNIDLIVPGFDASTVVEPRNNMLFISTNKECYTFQVEVNENNKITDVWLKNCHCYRVQSYRYRKLLWLSEINEIHLIADDNHLKWVGESNQFILLSKLPTINSKCIYLSNLNRIVFIGGQRTGYNLPQRDNLGNKYENKQNIYYINFNKSQLNQYNLEMRYTQMALPRKWMIFQVIHALGHCVSISAV